MSAPAAHVAASSSYCVYELDVDDDARLVVGDPLDRGVAPWRARDLEDRRLHGDVGDRAAALGQHDELVAALLGDHLQRLEPLHGVRVAVQHDRPRRALDPEEARLQRLVAPDVDAVLVVGRAWSRAVAERRAQVRRHRRRLGGGGERLLQRGDEAVELAGRRRRGRGAAGAPVGASARRRPAARRRGRARRRSAPARGDRGGGRRERRELRRRRDLAAVEARDRRRQAPRRGDADEDHRRAEGEAARRDRGQPAVVADGILDEPVRQRRQADGHDDGDDPARPAQRTAASFGEHEDRPVPQVQRVGVPPDPLQDARAERPHRRPRHALGAAAHDHGHRGERPG